MQDDNQPINSATQPAEPAVVAPSATQTTMQSGQQPVNVVVNQTVATTGTIKKNYMVALLLSIFLGTLGVDRFYLGNVGLGLLKLFTFGLFGILYLIDIIMIATKNIKGIEWE